MLGLHSLSRAQSCGGSDRDDRRNIVFLEMPSSDELHCHLKEYDLNDTKNTNQSLFHYGTNDLAKFQTGPGILLGSIGANRIIHRIICGGID